VRLYVFRIRGFVNYDFGVLLCMGIVDCILGAVCIVTTVCCCASVWGNVYWWFEYCDFGVGYSSVWGTVYWVVCVL